MTISTDPPPSRPKVTDDELERAVAHCCRTQKPPVAKTKDVADVEFIDVKPQTVKRRLDRLEEEGRVSSLKVSRGRVWWIPQNEGDEESDNDSSSIYWAGIDPEEIPTSMIKAHPDYPDPDRWEKLRDRGENMARDAAIPAAVGFAILLLRSVELPFISIGQDIYTIAVLLFIGGVLFVLVGFVFGLISNLGRRFEVADIEIDF
jgi:hypothetical protein